MESRSLYASQRLGNLHRETHLPPSDANRRSEDRNFHALPNPAFLLLWNLTIRYAVAVATLIRHTRHDECGLTLGTWNAGFEMESESVAANEMRK
ncbi:MAG: hypothetical protein M1834_008142 [Cirrosporium novae-zelandiae]|nr:MAG: hypothetical protein M1834_008142 [Cirrosporium novae-zelandiae]